MLLELTSPCDNKGIVVFFLSNLFYIEYTIDRARTAVNLFGLVLAAMIMIKYPA